MKNKVSTTIKIEESLYDEFKILGIRHKHSLQKLIEKTIFRYVKEEKYRIEMNNYIPQYISSSWNAISSSTVV